MPPKKKGKASKATRSPPQLRDADIENRDPLASPIIPYTPRPAIDTTPALAYWRQPTPESSVVTDFLATSRKSLSMYTGQSYSKRRKPSRSAASPTISYRSTSIKDDDDDGDDVLHTEVSSTVDERSVSIYEGSEIYHKDIDHDDYNDSKSPARLEKSKVKAKAKVPSYLSRDYWKLSKQIVSLTEDEQIELERLKHYYTNVIDKHELKFV